MKDSELGSEDIRTVSKHQFVHIRIEELWGDGNEIDGGDAPLTIERGGQLVGSHPHALRKLLLLSPRAAYRGPDTVADGYDTSTILFT